MRAHKAPASPLPPSAEGRITRLAAVHVKASCDLNSLLARAGLSPKDIEDARARIGVQNQITFLGIAALPAFEVVDPLPAGFLLEPVRDQTEELLLGLFAVSEEAREYGIDRCCVLRLILHRLVHRRIGRRARRKNPSNVLPAALTALPCMRGSSKRMVASGSLSSKNGTGASSGNDQPRWW